MAKGGARTVAQKVIWNVGCPTCGALSGESCTTAQGKREGPHMTRVERAINGLVTAALRAPLVLRVTNDEMGWPTTKVGNVRVFKDTGQRVVRHGPDSRPCKACGLRRTAEGHDPCIANLPGVQFACCGHGVHHGYVVFDKYHSKLLTGEDRRVVLRGYFDHLDYQNGELDPDNNSGGLA